MQVRVKKLGNSASIRIPSEIMRAARLQLGQTVDMDIEDGRLIVEPIHNKTYDLASMIAGTNDKNRHEAIDFGGTVGKEIW